jgi:hypothetical protein
MALPRGPRALPRLLCGGIALAASALAACTGTLSAIDPPGGGDAGILATVEDGSTGAAADAGDPGDPRVLFATAVDPILVRARLRGACADCHEGRDPGDGPDFLGPDARSHRDSLLGAPHLVGASADASLLFTRGDHTGDAFCTAAETPVAGCAADEAAIVAAWIAAEAAARAE